MATLFTNGQIGLLGLDTDHEGIACWDADGSGPEPEAYGHVHPFGFGSSLYYSASRDFIDQNQEAAMCHFLDNISGFPHFVQKLNQFGFTTDQVKVKVGLLQLNNDTEGEDWFTFNNGHYYNRYDAYYRIELKNEPMISGYLNFINISRGGNGSTWNCESNFNTPFDISENSSAEVQKIAESFLGDVGDNELRFMFRCTPVTNFTGNGRVNGYFFNVVSGYLEKGLPEIGFEGLASENQGIACWNADGTGPEPAATGHSYDYGGVSYLMPYYIASRDYDGIDPDKNAATGHITSNLKGFPNLNIQLQYRGYAPDQLRIKSGIGTLGNDLMGTDWGINGPIHWYHYYGFEVILEIAGEPILQFVMDTNYVIDNLAHPSNWKSNSTFSKVSNVSNTASRNAQYIALSFLKDLGGHSIKTYMEGDFRGFMNGSNGRISGVFHDIQNAKFIAKQPKGTHVWQPQASGIWSIDGSPYIIMDKLEIPVGEILTIEPGVEVLFNTTERFLIKGAIIAEGTKENPILFTSWDESVSWGGIEWNSVDNKNEESLLKYCIFENSYAYNNNNGQYCGGALRIYYTDQITICNCVFRNNQVDNYYTSIHAGGAILMKESSIHISHSIFHDNSAPWGGAIAILDNSKPVIDNCLFYNNSTNSPGGDGGAILVWHQSYPHFVNCTFADNHALNEGGAVEIELGGTTSFTNCIFWGNVADCGPDQINIGDQEYSKLHVLFCDIEGGMEGITPDFIGAYVENIDDNPNFVDIVGYRYVPDPYSAIIPGCINSGTLMNVFLPNNWYCPENCLCGNPRNVGPKIDMGCYESDIISLINQSIENDIVFKITPNPINSNPSIELTLENEEMVMVSVLDIAGKNVIEMEAQYLPEGKNQLTVEANILSPGIYVFALKIGNGKTIFKKAVKLH
jgi:hypothetical protein